MTAPPTDVTNEATLRRDRRGVTVCQAEEGVRMAEVRDRAAARGDAWRAATRPEGDLPSRRAVAVVIVLATAVAAALVMTGLGSKSLVRDEVASYTIAAMPWPVFVDDILSESFNSSLFYLFLRSVVPLSTEEWALRLQPAIAFIATVPVLTLFAWRLLGRRQAVAVAVLVAAQPFLVRTGQFARGYATLVLLSIVASWLFDTAVLDGRRRTWLAYGAVVGVSVYIHLFIVVFVMAHVLTLLPVRSRLHADSMRPAALLVTVLWAPMLYLALTRNEVQLSYLEAPPLTQPGRTAVLFAGSIPLFLVLTALVAWSLWRWFHSRDGLRSQWDGVATDVARWRRLVLAVTMAAPVLTVWLVSYVVPVYVSQYFISSLPPMLLLAADGLAGIDGVRASAASRWAGIDGVRASAASRWAGIDGVRASAASRWAGIDGDGLWYGALAGLLVLSLIPTTRYLRADFDQEDIRAAVRLVADRGDGDDALVFMPAHARVGFRYYRMVEPRNDVPVDVAQIDSTDPVLWRPERSPAEVARTLATHDEVWLVGYPEDDWHASPPVMEQVYADCLVPGFAQTSDTEFGEMHVMRWRRQPHAAAACAG
jgi:4-amino-4-deoxy-L-arabinose transferase-like glycosyltransferase